MKHPASIALLAYFLALALSAAAAPLAHADDGSFDLTWNTMDSGGGVSTGGGFELAGTIGQPDAGLVMTGGGFAFTGGFWPAAGGGTTCPADFDGDGDVDTADLLYLLGCWGEACGDVNGDGTTNTADLLELLGAWGSCP
jgi:hypothetical protein